MVDLAALPAWAFAFALVLSRCGAAMALLPGLGESELPAVVRAGLTLALVVLILPGVGQVPLSDGWETAVMVGAELLTGLMIGWLARSVTIALPIAGQIISFMAGLSNVISPDPVLGQSSAFMRLFSLVMPVLVLKTGLWALPVAALLGSYRLVGPGHFLPVADGTEAALAAVASAFGLALQLAAPFVVASTIWQVALGLMSRLVPQLQVFFAAVPGQILGGLALLALVSAGLIGVWLDATQASFAALPGLR